MKSNKQRRKEIKEKRHEEAEALAYMKAHDPPVGSVAADHSKLDHINTHGFLPIFYVDKTFTCRDCGSNEIWTAEQQKWWYETAKGHIHSTAVRCRKCRDKIKRGGLD